jgi:hypothetical protein
VLVEAQDAVTIGAATVALAQLTKWALGQWRGGRAQGYGPLVVLIVSALGVGLWALSRPALPTRLDLWTYFAAWIAVATSAVGIYGLVRTAAGAGEQRSD